MGTRCLTVFKDDDGEEICVLYRQFDGYVEGGHGEELVNFLKNKRIVNGFDTKETAFNGMGCLAAAVVAHFKTDIGNFYLHPAGTRDIGEDYFYIVENNNGHPKVTVIEVYDDKESILLDTPERPSSDSAGLSFPKGSSRTGDEMKQIRNILKSGDNYFVNFIKKYGSDRRMYCTRGPAFTENLQGKSKTFPKHLLPVWDIEEDGYRMINLKTTYRVKKEEDE